MNKSDEELFDAYLCDELTREEKILLAKRLDSEPESAQLFLEYVGETHALLRLSEEYHTQKHVIPSVSSGWWGRSVAIAAIFIVGIMTIFFISSLWDRTANKNELLLVQPNMVGRLIEGQLFAASRPDAITQGHLVPRGIVRATTGTA
ncbi:MAG: hypothetical protein HQL32_14030, partial [Planctomycetes bacterium]|nr:hypothetical protein [Planctomycetota bacterium]